VKWKAGSTGCPITDRCIGSVLRLGDEPGEVVLVRICGDSMGGVGSATLVALTLLARFFFSEGLRGWY